MTKKHGPSNSYFSQNYGAQPRLDTTIKVALTKDMILKQLVLEQSLMDIPSYKITRKSVIDAIKNNIRTSGVDYYNPVSFGLSQDDPTIVSLAAKLFPDWGFGSNLEQFIRSEN